MKNNTQTSSTPSSFEIHDTPRDGRGGGRPGGFEATGRTLFLVILSFAAIYLIWGSTYLAIRIGIETLPPFLLAGVRFCLAGALLYGALRLGGTPRPKASTWKSAALVGTLMMFGGNGLVTWAQQEVPSGLAALLIATVPIWMVVLDATVYGGGRPGKWVVLGLVMASLGLVVLVGPSEGAVSPWGALVLLLAALSWATGSLVQRSVSLPKSPWMSAAMQMIAGGVLMVVIATFTGEWSRLDPSTVSLRSILAFFYLVVFGSIVGLSAYVYLLRRTSAAAVSTYAFVNPVIALALGWLFGEVVTTRTLLGALMIVGSVFLIHWAKNRPKPSGESATADPVSAKPIRRAWETAVSEASSGT